jgi:hypothetical protein
VPLFGASHRLKPWIAEQLSRRMMRYVFKAIDFVISVVFLALCTKALCIHFYQDIEQQRHARKLLTSHPPDEIAIAQLPAPLSISVGSSASAFELLTRFDTGPR